MLKELYNLKSYFRLHKILFLFLLVVSYLPLDMMRNFGKLCGYIFYYVSPGFKRKFIENYTQANPDVIGNKRKIRHAYQQMGSLIAELPYIWLNNNALYKVSGDIEVINELLYQQKGLILVGLHGGAFELIPKYIMHKIISDNPLETSFTSMYKKPSINVIDSLLLKIRQEQNINIVPANDGGIRKLIKCLKLGQITAILPDQVPQWNTGVWVHFFDKLAYTGILLHKLHKFYDTPLILCHMLQTQNGWRFISKQIYIGSTEQESAQILNNHLEELIKLDYEQYLWGYNRYKTPKGASY